MEVPPDPLPQAVEAAVDYVVAEALTTSPSKRRRRRRRSMKARFGRSIESWAEQLDETR